MAPMGLSFVGRMIRAMSTPQPKVTGRVIQSLANEVVLKEELGSGRYGVVRVGARVSHPDERIAVKIVPKSRSTINELKNEIRCLNKVRGHKNVMELLDSFEDNTHAYILTP